jgi:hypothetical protein
MSLPNEASGRPYEDRYYLIFLKMVPEKPVTTEVVNLHAAHLESLHKDG